MLPLTSDSDAKITAIFVLSVAAVAVIRAIAKKVKMLTEQGLFFGRKEKLSIENYTLALENDTFFTEFPQKKISVTTKILLTLFIIAFVITPFRDFLPTTEYSNHLFYYGLNFF